MEKEKRETSIGKERESRNKRNKVKDEAGNQIDRKTIVKRGTR